MENTRSQQAFIQHGLASTAKARLSGKYVPADTVLAELAKKLEQTRARQLNGKAG